MVNMDKAMSEVNVSLDAYLSPCDQYGEDLQTAVMSLACPGNS